MFKRQKHLVIREISPGNAIYSMMTIKKSFLMVSVCKPSWLSKFFLIKKKNWLLWVFAAAHGLSLGALSGAALGCSAQAYCPAFSCCEAQALGAQASVVAACRVQGTWASVVVAHGLSSCVSWALEQTSIVVVPGLSGSRACGTFPYQGLNPCPLHWQVNSHPLYHQGNPLEVCFAFFQVV